MGVSYEDDWGKESWWRESSDTGWDGRKGRELWMRKKKTAMKGRRMSGKVRLVENEATVGLANVVVVERIGGGLIA